MIPWFRAGHTVVRTGLPLARTVALLSFVSPHLSAGATSRLHHHYHSQVHGVADKHLLVIMSRARCGHLTATRRAPPVRSPRAAQGVHGRQRPQTEGVLGL